MGDIARGELVVLTQNIFGGGPAWEKRKPLLARSIKRLAPDLIGLQEVHAASVRGAKSQAHELAELVGGYHVDFAPGRVAENGACEGVAILCRNEIRERSVEALTLDRSDFLDRAGQRVVLCAMLDLPCGPVDFFVTHLSLSSRSRRRTMRELVGFVERERRRSQSGGAILVGDLNALPAEEAVRMLCEGREACAPWLDAWRHCHPAARGGTWPAFAPLRRIDYIFAQPLSRWQVTRCARELSGADHLGVVATLELTP